MELLTVNPELLVCPPIVTDAEEALTNFPDAVAVAVTTAPAERLNPVFVHEPYALVVVVPRDVMPEKTSITVPLTSVDVPVIEVTVEDVQYVP